MTLPSGTRLGPYEITGAIGAGGMGEVYRATDTKLKREVAIKVLPQAFVEDKERLARFEREAQLLAQLHHPNIASIFGLEESGESPALVMELVEGPTLAERLAEGPIPVEEVLPIARQIAEALEYAHEHGIIHRDLKPANIKINGEDHVKILDFGLAKAMDSNSGIGSASGPVDLSHSPTMTLGATVQGMILGSAGYMSPEQARGRSADKRADIWAFGCVVFEMLSGRRAFPGETVSDTLASILKLDPDWDSLPDPVGPGVRRVLARCLEKDPNRRFHSTIDAAMELEVSAEQDERGISLAPGQEVHRRGRDRALIISLVLMTAVAASLGVMVLSRHLATPSAALGIVRADINAPPGEAFNLMGDQAGPPVPSPDGTRIAFTAIGRDGQTRLWIRSIDSTEARVVAGTENAMFPFWSPDGKSLGFFVPSGVMRVDLNGGRPLELAGGAEGASPSAKGGAWSSNGTILYSPAPRDDLYSVPASGGKPRKVLSRDLELHTTYRWPHFLPDGRHFIFFAGNHDHLREATNGIYLGSLDGGKPTQLLHTMGEAIYSSGYLLYVERGNLMAQGFDPAKLILVGTPITMRESVQFDPTTWKAGFGAAATGRLLVYAQGGEAAGTELRWYDRHGTYQRSIVSAPNLQAMQLSPDKKMVAAAVQTDAPTSDIWVYGADGSSPTRLTFDPAGDSDPVWTPDGTHLYFTSARGGKQNRNRIYELNAAGGGEPRLVLERQDDVFPWAVSSGGRALFYGEGDFNNFVTSRPWVLVDGKTSLPIPIDQGARMLWLAVSPHDRFLAYASDVSGRSEVYVTRLRMPPPGPVGASWQWTQGKWQISFAGGSHPRWAADGKQLIYLRSDNTLVSVKVELQASSLKVLAQQSLFSVFQRSDAAAYDVADNGERFLINTIGSSTTRPLTVVLNWQQELKGRGR